MPASVKLRTRGRDHARGRPGAATKLLSLSPASAMLLSFLAALVRALRRARDFRTEIGRGGMDTIGNDAAQLVVNVDDAFQLVGGLGEDPAARTCSLRTRGAGGDERRDVTIGGDAIQLVENAPRDARPRKIGMSLLC